MRPGLNTLFGRLALLTVGLVVLVHLTAVWLIDGDREATAAGHMSRLATLMRTDTPVPQADKAKMADVLGLLYVPAGQELARGCPPPCGNTDGNLERLLRARMPAGAQAVLDDRSGDLWVLSPGARDWLVLPHAMLPAQRKLTLSLAMLGIAITLALLAAWQFQRPLRRLVLAAREFQRGLRPAPVPLSGPGEMRELIADFNAMIEQVVATQEERDVMLAGVAHDLRAPITRLTVRADLLPDPGERAGFLRDTESLSGIVSQFLDLAGQSNDTTPLVQVDAYCHRHYGAPDDGQDPEEPVTLDLRAGRGFTLPETDLARILSNLIENALTYGEPPVEIRTATANGQCTLSVRDHGGGIAAEQIERALRPFVRLDPARGGDAHCGMGLAIVRRLVWHNGGSIAVGNAAGGGLEVVMAFPCAKRG